VVTFASIELNAVQGFLDNLVQIDQPQAQRLQLGAVVDEVRRLGLEPADPVMVAMPNGRPLIAVVFALLAWGAVPVLLPPSAPPSRIQRMAQALGAEALIAPRIPADLQGGELPHWLGDFAQLIFCRGVTRRRYGPGEIILLTSGTSGVFSGCLHRLDSLLLNAERHVRAIGQTADDSVLINLPLHYSYAFVAQLLGTFALGGKAIIAGPPFTSARYERTIQDYGVTVSSLVPGLVASWRLTRAKLPAGLRRLTVGGDALSASSVTELLQHNPGLELYLTYGLTEAGPRVSTLAAHLEPPHRYGSVGLPLPGVEVHLRRASPDADLGELVVETDTGMLRRVGWRDVPATPACDNRSSISTGDLFTMDDDGYLFFSSRRPSSVIIRGQKVCLRSVCAIAETIPGVCGAEAWTHEATSGEVVLTLDAYCADEASIDAQELRQQLAKLLLRSEQPARLLVHPVSHLGWRKPDAI
jgi:long-chain acyl-CoA synthetase